MKRFSGFLPSTRQLARVGVLLLIFALSQPSRAADLQTKVASALAKVGALKAMAPERTYTLTARGKAQTGLNDDFLRRRDGAEILKSGLSCGCGDYALAFVRLMAAQSVQMRWVEGAEISTASLADHFSGHVLVAVRDGEKSDWWLVNPTDQTILSKHWAPTARSFDAFGRFFWIGYNGPLEAYPAHNPSELQRFYAATLHQVPVSVLNQHLKRLQFTVDASLRDPKGNWRNPRVAKFLALQPAVFGAYHVSPLRVVKVELVRGDNDGESRIAHLPSGWRGSIGLQSACSPSLFDYFEQNINTLH